ncbi:MAG: hypothetical protein ACK4K4_00015 [Caldimicrobium sp.]
MKRELLVIILFLLFLTVKFGHTEETKKVLVLPFEIYAQQDISFLKKALPEMLTSRLFTPNKIQVIELDKIESELKNYTSLDKKVAEEIAKRIGADYVIWGSITLLGDVVSIDAQVMDLSMEKKPVQFFQEIKGLSEVIPQLTRFAKKAKRYIEGKEEDFYQEELALPFGGQAYAYGRAHPERGYFGYPLYPIRPPKEENTVEKAKPRFGGLGDPAYEGLTKDVVIDLSGAQPKIGIAKEERDNSTKTPKETPPYMYYYPPQPYYNYSPPPYYYYQASPQDEGLLSKMKSAIWPFGKEKRIQTPPPQVQTVPQINPSQGTLPIPQPSPSPQAQTPHTENPISPIPPTQPQRAREPVKNNPWRWE